MKWTSFACAVLLTSCSGVENASRPDIAPEDFALVPCGPNIEDKPCALIVVGGKRLLFGAPAGVAETLDREDLRLLDGIFLFSLRAQDMEGLDEVRNASWQAGRAKPLSVMGPEKTDQIVASINLAFETADALRIVDEGLPRGGYDGALLTAMEGQAEQADLAFDTGDVQVKSEVRKDQALKYSLVYRGADPVVLEPCRDGTCTIVEELVWPLQDTHFIVKN